MDESKTFIHATNMVALSASLACMGHSPLSIASMASSLDEVVHKNTYPYITITETEAERQCQ